MTSNDPSIETLTTLAKKLKIVGYSKRSRHFITMKLVEHQMEKDKAKKKSKVVKKKVSSSSSEEVKVKKHKKIIEDSEIEELKEKKPKIEETEIEVEENFNLLNANPTVKLNTVHLKKMATGVKSSRENIQYTRISVYG